MDKITLFILSTAGLSWILCRSKLFKSLREYFSIISENIQTEKKFNKRQFFGKEYFVWFVTSILGCHGCMGFWAAQLNFILIFKTISLDMLFYGFIGSITSLIIVNYSSFLERK